jgi:hypothetical protein
MYNKNLNFYLEGLKFFIWFALGVGSQLQWSRIYLESVKFIPAYLTPYNSRILIKKLPNLIS